MRPARSPFLYLLDIQYEAPCRIGRGLADRVVLGHHVKRIDAVPSPAGDDDRSGKGSLGLRIDHLSPVWPPRPIKIAVPALSLLRENRW